MESQNYRIYTFEKSQYAPRKMKSDRDVIW